MGWCPSVHTIHILLLGMIITNARSLFLHIRSISDAFVEMSGELEEQCFYISVAVEILKKYENEFQCEDSMKLKGSLISPECKIALSSEV